MSTHQEKLCVSEKYGQPCSKRDGQAGSVSDSPRSHAARLRCKGDTDHSASGNVCRHNNHCDTQYESDRSNPMPNTLHTLHLSRSQPQEHSVNSGGQRAPIGQPSGCGPTKHAAARILECTPSMWFQQCVGSMSSVGIIRDVGAMMQYACHWRALGALERYSAEISLCSSTSRAKATYCISSAVCIPVTSPRTRSKPVRADHCHTTQSAESGRT